MWVHGSPRQVSPNGAPARAAAVSTPARPSGVIDCTRVFVWVSWVARRPTFASEGVTPPPGPSIRGRTVHPSQRAWRGGGVSPTHSHPSATARPVGSTTSRTTVYHRVVVCCCQGWSGSALSLTRTCGEAPTGVDLVARRCSTTGFVGVPGSWSGLSRATTLGRASIGPPPKMHSRFP